MTYTPPTTEQLFVLNHIARVDAMAAHDKFAAATPDMVEAIVTGIGEFACRRLRAAQPRRRHGQSPMGQWQGHDAPGLRGKRTGSSSRPAGAASTAPANMADRICPSPSPPW